ncbi:protocatechuate 3,4-dioxygenase [bacterium]|nr:protocatechuate 3,4-dioxygenase [bacterium]
MREEVPVYLSRRQVLASGLKAYALLSANLWLLGCARASEGTGSRAISQGAASWAAGGTGAMRGTYPNPFQGRESEPCVLTPALTEGPCHAATLNRKDISEGISGLPMRLSLRITRADACTPVPNASVDVWHASPAGYYSAFPAGSICNPSSTDAQAEHFCRGVQSTDANGVVDFDSVFPGWYPGRTTHVHFIVRVGDQAYLTSQLFYDDALSDEIFSAHPDYRGRPRRDTTNQTDAVLVGRELDPFLLRTARMADGALQAWKTITLR